MSLIESNVLSTAIAFVALLISISGSIYTVISNRSSIDVSSTYIHYEENRPNQISFRVNNTGNKSLKITNISLYDNFDNPVLDNGYNPSGEHTTSIGPMGIETKIPVLTRASDFSNTFKSEITIAPHKEIELRYYVNKTPCKIDITSNKRIDRLSLNKSFFVNFIDAD